MAYVTIPAVEVLGLVRVLAGIVLVPLDVNPEIAGVPVIAVQVNVAPLTPELIVTNEELVPEQTVCVNGLFVTVGIGFTVTVTVNGVPVQVPFFGVTVYVTVPADVIPGLVRVWLIEVTPVWAELPVMPPVTTGVGQV
jgi:hypothetical protein